MKIMFAVPIYQQISYSIPYGVSIIASVAKNAGLEVQILSANSNETDCQFIARLVEEVEKQSIDVVALGGHSIHYSRLKILLSAVKNSGVITVLGGIIVDSLPEIVAVSIGADYYVYGEGEYTFIELIQSLQSGTGINDVRGLIYLNESGELIKTEPRECVNDLNELPFIDGDLCHFDRTLQNCSTIHMEFSRSCPFNCTFCYKISGSQYRVKRVDRFFNELDYYVKKYGEKIKSIYLIDEALSINKTRLLEFCNRAADYRLNWEMYLRADVLDEECVIALKQLGMKQLFIGLESASNKVLTSMKKDVSIEQIENVFTLATKYDLVITAKLIIGDKEDDLNTIKESESFYFSHIYKHNVYIDLLRVYPGSFLYNYAVDRRIIKNELEFLINGCPPINVSKIPNNVYELLSEKYQAYSRGRFIERQLRTEKRDYGSSNNMMYQGDMISCICSACYTYNEFTYRGNMATRLHCYTCSIELNPTIDTSFLRSFQTSNYNIINIYNNLGDVLSKSIFEKRILYSLTNDNRYINEIIEISPDLKLLKDKIEQLIKRKKRVIAYGSGMKGVQFGRLCKDLNIKITAFCDSDEEKWGKELYDYQIISPDELWRKHSDAFIVITPIEHAEIHKNLLDMGFEQEQLFLLSKQFEDTVNKQYFDTSILTCQCKDEIFIDAGCLNCSTSNDFINWCSGEYKKIIAFEPNQKQYDICVSRSENINNITLHPYALWSEKAEVEFAAELQHPHSGTICKNSIENVCNIKAVRLDDILDGDEVTFIKMDVEGAELEALKGSRRTILKNRPKLAICLYHKPEDIWEIPSYILSLHDDYKLYIRHYQLYYAETVLYAL